MNETPPGKILKRFLQNTFVNVLVFVSFLFAAAPAESFRKNDLKNERKDGRKDDTVLNLKKCWQISGSENEKIRIGNASDKTFKLDNVDIDRKEKNKKEILNKETLNKKVLNNVNAQNGNSLKSLKPAKWSKSFLYYQSGKIFSFDVFGGQVEWSFENGGRFVPTLFVGETGAYAVNSIVETWNEPNFAAKKIVLTSFDGESGIPIWKTSAHVSAKSVGDSASERDASDNLENNLENDLENAYLFERENRIYVLTTEGEFVSFDKSDGSIVWKKNLNVRLRTAPSFSDGRAAIAGDDGAIRFVALADGEMYKKLRVSADATALLDFGGHFFVYGNEKGEVVAVGEKNGRTIWKMKTGGRISGVSATARGLLVASYDNFVYMLAPNDGGKIWKRRFSSRVVEKPSLNGELAVVVAADSPEAFFIGLKDGRTLSKISLPAESRFEKAPVRVGKQYVFQTDEGIVSYSNECR